MGPVLNRARPNSSVPAGPAQGTTVRPGLDWLRLFLEFVIVVAGITLSFWVQDLRQAKRDRAEETRYLVGLQRDLQTDRETLTKTMGVCDKLIDQIDHTFDAAPEAELTNESIDRAMDALLTYSSFASSRATYRELQQTGASKLIRDKSLLGEVIGLYERTHANADEWDLINRSYVLDRMFPYLDEHGPVIKIEFVDAYAAGYHVAYEALKGEPHFQNLVRTNRMFKSAQRAVYEGIVGEIDRVLLLFP